MSNPRSDFLRYDATDTDDLLLVKYLKEINESPENKARCLEILRRDLKNLKDIEPCLEEDFLLRFLRVSKYDTSKALQRVMKYYQQFDIYLDTYRNLTFCLHELDCIRHLTMSPYRCRDNSFLLFGKAGIDYKKFGFAEIFYLEILALPQILDNPINQICGGTYIFDYEGLDIHGYLAFTPFWMRLFVDSLMNVFPCRLKAVHVVNMPSFFPLLLQIVYPFLPKKIQNRVFFHARKDGWKNLHAFISPDILSEKYGGKLKQDELIDCLHNLNELEEKFHSSFAFGNIKTKKDRQSLKVLK